jgi:flagellar motor protein MotB
MKSTLLLPVAILMLAVSCTSGTLGKKVKEPFTGRAYESNNRFFRGTGKGESSQDNIARGKADIEAKAQLASQVQTNVKEVTDQYLGQTSNEAAADVADKFQSLVREVMNTQLADVRKIGEEKYYNEKEKKYTVFMAYEIKKNAMFRFMKKQAKVDTKINDKQREAIEKILDEQIAAADAAEKEGDN